MPGVDLGFAIGLEPKDAIAYLKAKGYTFGFSWTDVWQEAHAKAFTAAGVMKADVLADLRGGLVEALKTGATRQDFIDRLTPILQQKGWWGAHAQTDPVTGEIRGKGLTPRRLATIFDTNMQTAYMAGRYRAFMANAEDRPYWQYVAIMDQRTRPAHAALNRRTFRYDDPIWSFIYPPNGFRCRCSVRALDAADVASRGIDVSSSEGRLSDVQVPTSRKPDAPLATVTRFEYAPGKYFAPDPGWNYNPGASALGGLQEVVDQRLSTLDAPLGAAMWQGLKTALGEETATRFGRWVDDVLAAGRGRGLYAIVGAMTQREVSHYTDAAGIAPATAEIAVEDRLLVGKKADRHARKGNALTADEWKSLPLALVNERCQVQNLL
ncbi:phage minor head protein [Accumulibacter sp.]|uniref:phage head morphogenesis protein n=1 Tax=Accumulibacter sp. TaxID=2053492 RepID=UPI0025D4B58C|nr:phage minor head protein [Accumulibacter sp.]MCM8625291.1 phage minor head protein [Accumulibacter sp.]